jgi:glycosyltransferase involved in cell wall biosynthesis
MALLKWNRDVLRMAVRCDALYVNGIRCAYSAAVACIYCRMAGKRVIYQFHDLIPYRSRALWFLRFVVRDFIHNTEAGYRLVSKINPFILRCNNHVIPYVIQPSEGRGREGAVDALARGKRAIVFVGQVSLHKGVDLLLQAFALLDDYPDVMLLIAGGCAPEFAPVLDSMLRDARLAGRVVHLDYQEDVLPLLSGAYLYVHPTPPSRFLEAFGRSALEAMACGVPAVCFPAGAIGEVVVHGETGLVCDRENAECLAENLRRFLDDRQFRDRCGARSRERFLTVYASQHVAAGWGRLLEER